MIKLDSEMFRESKKSTASENILINIVVFFVVFFIIQLAESAIPSMLSNAELKQALAAEGLLEGGDWNRMIQISTRINMQPKYLIPTLFCTAFGTIISMIHCRFVEARYIKSMGVKKEKAFLHYFQGFGVGILLMTAIVLLSVLFRISNISLCADINSGMIALYFFGFFFQGMSEEFIFRGYLMTTIGARHKPLIAIIISALAFSLAHFANEGFNFVSFFNLALFGVFASLYMICYDDIWGVSAIHSMWNFTQGSLYGISVSGTGNIDSVFRTESISSSAFLTGGEFGIEGSVITTLVLGAGTALMLYKLNKKADS